MLAVAAAALLACNESDVKKYAISGTGLEDGAQVQGSEGCLPEHHLRQVQLEFHALQ